MGSASGAYDGELEGFTLQVFGIRWRVRPVRVPDSFVTELRGLWSRAIVDPALPDPDDEDFVVCDAVGGFDPFPPEHAAYVGSDRTGWAYSVSRALTMASIRRRTGQALMLHAVGVTDDTGSTLVLVAPSGTGKTTAAKELGRSLGYVTDETVVIEPDHAISPYPKPLSIIVDTDQPHDKEESSPDDLHLVPAHDTPRLGAVVLLRRDGDLAQPDLAPLPLAEAMLETIPETSALPALEQPLATLARALSVGGGPYRLRYAEIADCVPLLHDLPRLHADVRADWLHIPSDGRDDPAPASSGTVTGRSLVVRSAWDDAVLSDHELVVLHDLVPSRLGLLGTELWLAADAPVSVEALHERMVEAFGSHEESERLLLESVQLLVDSGVLRVLAGVATAAGTEQDDG